MSKAYRRFEKCSGNAKFQTNWNRRQSSPAKKEKRMDSLQTSDAAAAAVAVAPRVTLADIEANIAECFTFTLDAVAIAHDKVISKQTADALRILTICVLITRAGFTIIGKSAPASPENFDAALGEKFAREDAVRQLWPLMGFNLREQLHQVALAERNSPDGADAQKGG